jgi:hypothetical protein
MRALFPLVRRAYTWALRLAISILMLTGYLPPPLLREWLRWLHESMHPQHHGLPTVLAELAEVEERCRA